MSLKSDVSRKRRDLVWNSIFLAESLKENVWSIICAIILIDGRCYK